MRSLALDLWTSGPLSSSLLLPSPSSPLPPRSHQALPPININPQSVAVGRSRSQSVSVL